jgi:hypothetical protein
MTVLYVARQNQIYFCRYGVSTISVLCIENIFKGSRYWKQFYHVSTQTHYKRLCIGVSAQLCQTSKRAVGRFSVYYGDAPWRLVSLAFRPDRPAQNDSGLIRCTLSRKRTWFDRHEWTPQEQEKYREMYGMGELPDSSLL